jgi:hypothetical protein
MAVIQFGSGIRPGAGWILDSDTTSNPTEYAPYIRQIPDAITTDLENEFGFGGGYFGLGAFGVGENLEDPTFTQDVPYTPAYT